MFQEDEKHLLDASPLGVTAAGRQRAYFGLVVSEGKVFLQNLLNPLKREVREEKLSKFSES